jgi:hypothetical protein
MTSPRAAAAGPVYAAFGELPSSALTIADALASGLTLVRIPLDVLLPLETGSPALIPDALGALARLCDQPLVGAVGLDDYWNIALGILNPGFPIAAARELVTDKAALYTALNSHGAAVPDFIAGSLGTGLLADALSRLGPRPVLKPRKGDASRGVYRYRPDLTVSDNLALYRQMLSVAHIDSGTDIMAVAYVGGEHALEISVDIIVSAGQAVHAVAHDKLTASRVHPFVDRVMVSPPTRPGILQALPLLPGTITAIISVLGLADGALHAELRLDDGKWHVLDVGVRPGAGLIPHSVQALTGVDPRIVHLAASAGRPLPGQALGAAAAGHSGAAIACCYITDGNREAVTLSRQAHLAAVLRKTPGVLGWHLNACEAADQIYRPDAGLSIGLAAPAPGEALNRLRSIVEPFSYSTC